MKNISETKIKQAEDNISYVVFIKQSEDKVKIYLSRRILVMKKAIIAVCVLVAGIAVAIAAKKIHTDEYGY